jgi:hypothetical protein
MQKLSLKDFEHSISPATWETADDLVQAGRVKNLREIEKHFWVALVETDEGNYESEVMITPHKIKAYACECFGEGRRLMCAHIAATLLKLRQFLEQRAENKRLKAEQKSSTELTRFTVQTALDNASPNELADFVKDYARRDKDFALALKTRFAALVTDSENPYALVLDSVIPRQGIGIKIGEPDFRRLRKALDDIEQQLEKAISNQDYRNQYLISWALFSKIQPLLTKTEGNKRNTLLHFCQKAFKGLEQIGEGSASPELREKVWEALFDWGKKDLFPPELSRDAIRYLSVSASESSKFDRLNSLFDQTPYPAPAFILQLFLSALAIRNRPESTVRVLEDYIENPEAIKDAFLQLYYLKHWDAATNIGEHFLNKQLFNPGIAREIENVLLFIAEQQNDQVRQIHWLRRRFLTTGHQELFERLRIAAAGQWPVIRQELIQELVQKGDTIKTASLLASENDLTQLAQLLEKDGDLNLLQRYEHLFLPDQKAFVQKMYIELLSQYLMNHFGTPAAQHVRLRLAELLHKGETEMVIQIIRALSTLFPERLSLPSELAELFPKSKRKEIR